MLHVYFSALTSLVFKFFIIERTDVACVLCILYVVHLAGSWNVDKVIRPKAEGLKRTLDRKPKEDYNFPFAKR